MAGFGCNIGETVDITASWKLSNGLNSEISLPFDVEFTDGFNHTKTSNLLSDCIFTFNNTQNRGLYTVNITLASFNRSVSVDVGKIKTKIIFTVNSNELYSNEKLIVNAGLYDENNALVNDKLYVSIAGQTKEVSSNQVVFTNLLPDTYVLKIEYMGSDDYFKSQAFSNITVKKYPVALTVEQIGDVYVDENFTINIILATGEMEGAANLYINGEFKNIVYLKTGGTLVGFSNFNSGKYNLTIEIVGNEYYQSTNASVMFNVLKYDSKLNVSSKDIFINENETLTITASEDFTGNVILSINGVNNTLFLNATETYILLPNLSAGRYDVDVVYISQLTHYLSSNTTSIINILPTVNGTDVVKVFRNGTQYYATFRNNEGNYLKNGTSVRFNINGVIYNRNVAGDKGLARLNINLAQGDYVITAFNPETGENTANNITVIPKLVENRDITKYYRNGTQYTVKVIGDDGNPVGAGESVRFNINGVFYTRQTDANGIAKLNINLQSGDYVITAEYSGCMVSNKIKVLPTLSASDISMSYRDGTQFKANVVDGTGSPLSGVNIIFNINGVFYTRISNINGQASLNINLLPGEYIITSVYDELNIANKITIH